MAALLSPYDVFPSPNLSLSMNHVRELARIHNPAILVIMETRLGGARAKEIADRLPFDGAIHTEIVGFTRGL